MKKLQFLKVGDVYKRQLTKSGTEYIGKSIGVYMGAVCGMCMALSVIAEELISKARHK